jgi:hypothetical protein
MPINISFRDLDSYVEQDRARAVDQYYGSWRYEEDEDYDPWEDEPPIPAPGYDYGTTCPSCGATQAFAVLTFFICAECDTDYPST